ncbi:MAG: response regulator [Saprospiraceae bacterium]
MRFKQLLSWFGVFLLSCFPAKQSPAQTTPDTIQQQIEVLEKRIEQSEGVARLPHLEALYGLYFQTNLEKAMATAREAEEIALKTGSSESLMKSLRDQGAVFNKLEAFDSMRICNERLLVLAQKNQSKKFEAAALNNIAMFFERSGSLDSAMHYNQKVLLINPPEDRFGTLNNIGRIYSQQKNFNQAIKYLDEAMREAEAVGEKNSQAIIANNIGGQYQLIKMDAIASQYFNKALELKKEIGDQRGQLFSLFNLVNCSTISAEEKEKYIQEGLRIASETNYTRFHNMFTESKARLLHAEGKYQEAIDLITPLYAAAQESPSFDFPFLASVLTDLHIASGNPSKAREYALALKAFAEERNSLEDLQKARMALLKIYDQSKDAANYMAIAKPYYHIKDSLDAQLNLDQFAYLESELDEEQKNKMELLNQSVRQKTRSRNILALSAILLTLLLSLILYFRNKLVHTQKEVILQEQKNNEHLEERNAMLKAHAEFRDRLYANITHEFKTPLTVIKGTIQQLEKENSIANALQTDSGIASKLQVLKRNGDNLLDLINKILDLSKLEEQLAQAHNQHADIVPYLHYLGESFQSLFEEKNIRFDVEGSESEIYMDYDPDLIKQLVTNLISNAIKHTPENGHIALQIEQRNDISGQAKLAIQVTDTGTGIPADQLPLIFDRYYQVKDAGTPSGGTGIGLALCKEIVNLLSGNISVESSPGQGSVFSILLPIQHEAKSSADILEAHPGNAGSSGAVLELNASKPQVLVVEDNEDVARFLTSCLHDGYECSWVENGKAGLEKSMELIPDLIITDIAMPLMDGYQFCEALKTNELTSHIPVIMLTAKSEQEAKLKGLQTGADAFLLKPFDTEELLIRVHKLIENRSLLRKHFSSSKALRTKPAGLGNVDQAFFDKVYQVVEENIDNGQLGVELLAKEIGMSQSQLNRKLKALTNLSANKFILTVRLKHALALLEKGEANVSEVSFQCGFNSVAYFVKCFKEQFGETPGAYQKK